MRIARPLLTLILGLLAVALVAAPGEVRAQGTYCCVVPDNGGGTADHPPSCSVGYSGYMEIIDGLPPGSTIQAPSILGGLGGFPGLVQVPGGPLGGMTETWTSTLTMHLLGTGAYAGYNRIVSMGIVNGTSHSAPRVPFASPQAFLTDLYTMQGQLPPGDPDFDLLRVTAGTGFGMPSPGHTTLTAAPGGWAVDSFFDITYRIDFVGSPGGPFAGMSGSTTGVLHRFGMCNDRPTPTQQGTWGALKSIYR